MNPTLTSKIAAILAFLYTIRRGLEALSGRRNKLASYVLSDMSAKLEDAIDALNAAQNDANDLLSRNYDTALLAENANAAASEKKLYRDLFRATIAKPSEFPDVAAEWKVNRINAIKMYRGKFTVVMPLIDAKTLCEDCFGPYAAHG